MSKTITGFCVAGAAGWRWALSSGRWEEEMSWAQKEARVGECSQKRADAQELIDGLMLLAGL